MRKRIFLAAVGLWGFPWCAATAQQKPPLEEFLDQFCSAISAVDGAIEAVYRNDGPSRNVGEYIFGFDARTGAWYVSNGYGVELRDDQGRHFRGESVYGGLRPHPNGSDIGLVDVFPNILIRHCCQNRSAIQAVERSDAGFVVTTRFEISGDDPRTIEFEIDSSGRVIRTTTRYKQEIWEQTFEYDERSPDGLPVPIRLRSGRELASVTSYPVSDPSLFRPDRIESLAVQSSLNVKQRLAAKSQGFVQTAPGVFAPPVQRGTEVANPLAGWRFPLIACGVTAIAVGLFYLWRRRVS